MIAGEDLQQCMVPRAGNVLDEPSQTVSAGRVHSSQNDILAANAEAAEGSRQ